MNISHAQFWFNVIDAGLQLGLWLFVWISSRNRVVKEELDSRDNGFAKDIELLRVDIGRIDERLKKAIGHTDLEPMHRRINNVDKQMSEMMGEFKGVKHLLELIHQNMLNNGGKS